MNHKDFLKTIKFDTINEKYMGSMYRLWEKNYNKYRLFEEIGQKINENFFADHIKDYLDRCLVVISHNEVKGFMAYDSFTFHGEETAFVPVLCHGAADEYRESLYKIMYHELASRWVNNKILNHFMGIFSDDDTLKDILYNYGFGLYVVDAFRKPEIISVENNNVKVKNIKEGKPDDFFELYKLAPDYYSKSPIFLVKEPNTVDDAKKIIENESVGGFIAYLDNKPAGFMTVTIFNKIDPYSMAENSMEAYILPEYRGKGLGDILLSFCMDWCIKKGMEIVHVDFESSNPYGNKFWTKNFKPLIHWVKRRINQDIVNTPRIP